MGFFRKPIRNLEFSRFSADHFRNAVRRVLWQGEKILADGFFEDGPDPLGEEDLHKFYLGRNAYTYIAATDWRLIVGYLANGSFSSFPYENSEIKVSRKGSSIFLTYTNQILRNAGSTTFRSTYTISEHLLRVIENAKSTPKPVESEKSRIRLTRIGWGEGPLADMAKARSGRDYQLIEVCEECNAAMPAAEGIEMNPGKGHKYCGACLRTKGD